MTVRDPERIDLRDVARVVRASAENRLGRPLLRLWAVYVLVAAAIVAASVAWMYLGR